MPQPPYLYAWADTPTGIVHHYLQPHPLLRPYIAHYTVTPPYHKAVLQPLTLIPDASGCIVYTLLPQRPQGFLWGPTTQTATVGNLPGTEPCHLFVEFRPGGAYRLTGVAQQELTDRVVALPDCLPALHAALCEIIFTADSPAELTAMLDALFLRLLYETPSPNRPSLGALLTACSPASTAAELADGCCYSLRHLNRLFEDELGIGVKQALRLLRVNRAVMLLHGTPRLAECAQLLGYYDQSHFIREFRAVCGISPGEYRNNLSVFYNEERKFYGII